MTKTVAGAETKRPGEGVSPGFSKRSENHFGAAGAKKVAPDAGRTLRVLSGSSGCQKGGTTGY